MCRLWLHWAWITEVTEDERLIFHSYTIDLIATLIERVCVCVCVCVETESTGLCLLRLQKAQYCLLAHSNQAELLLAHWDFFQSSRLPLHHWQQVWKQQTHSQDTLHAARLFFFYCKICLQRLVFSSELFKALPFICVPYSVNQERSSCSWGQSQRRVSVSRSSTQCAKRVSTSLRVLITSGIDLSPGTMGPGHGSSLQMMLKRCID